MIDLFKKRKIFQDKYIEKKRKLEKNDSLKNKINTIIEKNRIEEEEEEEKIEKCISLLYGIDVERNEEEAKKICLEISEKKNKFSKALQNYMGWQCDKQIEKTIENLTKILKSKAPKKRNRKIDSHALNLIGKIYEMGEQVEKDYNKAMQYYMKSIELNDNLLALNNLARMFEKGLGCEKDEEKAIKYYLKSIEQGSCSVAIYKLAKILEKNSSEFELKFEEDGDEFKEQENEIEADEENESFSASITTIEEDPFLHKEKQMICFTSKNKNNRRNNRESSANSRLKSTRRRKSNNPSTRRKTNKKKNKSKQKCCLTKIASLIRNGNNQEKANKLFEVSCELGNSKAMHHLSQVYERGKEVEKDEEKAVDLLKKSCELGNHKSCYKLAHMYWHGKLVEKNEEKALHFFRISSDLGNSDAMNDLAYFYNKGISGLEIDKKKSLELYLKSSELGNISAMNNLATIYQEGNGVEKNLKKSFLLYQKASLLGNKKATNNLALMYLTGCGVEKNVEKSIELLEDSSRVGSVVATNNLAAIFESGKDVAVNLEKSAFYYFKSFNFHSEIEKNKIYFKQKFDSIISGLRVEWRREYHRFWSLLPSSNQQIFALLLISKYRALSNIKETNFFVKGVMMNIIKFLCHFQQTTEQKD